MKSALEDQGSSRTDQSASGSKAPGAIGCLDDNVGPWRNPLLGSLSTNAPPPRTAGDGAGAGAIAGLITALVGGVINMIVSTIQFSLFGGQAAVLSQIPLEAMMQFEQAGIDPGIFVSTGGVLGVTAVCCGFGLVLAAILGAVGGAIFSSAKAD